MNILTYLLRELFEDLLCKDTSLDRISVLNELYTVAKCHLTRRSSDEGARTISVEEVHLREIGSTDSNDNDTARTSRAPDDKLFGSRHVMDDSISEKDKSLVHFVSLKSLSFHMLYKSSQNASKHGRATKFDLRKSTSVHAHDVLHELDFRLLRVTVQREAMADSRGAHVVGNTTKSENREALIKIVRFKDATHLEHSSFILIQVGQGMEGIRVVLVSIRGGVVNSHDHRNLPSRVDDLHERRLLLHFPMFEPQFRVVGIDISMHVQYHIFSQLSHSGDNRGNRKPLSYHDHKFDGAVHVATTD